VRAIPEFRAEEQMRRRRVLVFAAGAAAVWCVGPLAVPGAVGAWAAAAARGAAASLWGRAIEVPGLGALNKGGHAGVSEVSCSSAGNCAAGGWYWDQHRHVQGFVVSERNGRWGRAIELPGLGALNTGGFAQVSSVSCALPGHCAAGGFYRNRRGHGRAFVAVERYGRWRRAIDVPGLGALNTGGHGGGTARVSSVSCGSAGSCAAGGFYTDGGGHRQGFVASERNGVWGQAIEVPGPGALNQGGNAGVVSVSCGSAGSCAAGGNYTDGGGQRQGFVASETNDVWGQAIEVPGLGPLNQGGNAGVVPVSCASAGNCAAGGGYTDSSGYEQGFVARETNGGWGKAIEVPGLGALNGDSDASRAYVGSVSCASPGNCAAGGAYGWPYSWAFVASEKNGGWGKAIKVPGLGALVNGRWAYVGSVSCASAGNCAAGGDYENFAPDGPFDHAFVVSQQNGRWDRAINVPGLKVLNKGGDANVGSVSCGSAGNCVAGGAYTDGHGHVQGFVT